MGKVLHSIDRWGPALVSVVTLFFLAAFGWSSGVKVAKLEGKVEALQSQLDHKEESETAIRNELIQVTKWMVAVHERGSAAGWKLPDLPNNTAINPNPRGESRNE